MVSRGIQAGIENASAPLDTDTRTKGSSVKKNVNKNNMNNPSKKLNGGPFLFKKGSKIKSYKYPASGIEKSEPQAKSKAQTTDNKSKNKTNKTTKVKADRRDSSPKQPLDRTASITRVVYPDPRGAALNDTVYITTYRQPFVSDKTVYDYVTHNGQRVATSGYNDAFKAFEDGRFRGLQLKPPYPVTITRHYRDKTKYINK